MKKALKKIFIFLVISVAIMIAIPKVINLIKYSGYTEPKYAAFTPESIEKKLDEQPSDIEGWSNGDKFRAHLNPQDGSDTDGDGLTDKEEIEVYNSDPTKTSTAGDLYKDGYKVENGMDINTFYEMENVTFDHNECKEVDLTATEVSDLFAHVSEMDAPDIDGYTVYKAYDVYCYNNELTIDVSDIVESNDISAKDVTVLVAHWYGGDCETPKTKADGNNITVKYTFEGEKRYTVMVARKDGIFSPSKPSYKMSFNSDDGDIQDDANFLYAHVFSFRNLFMDAKPHLYYVPTGDRNKDLNTVRYLMAISRKVTDGYHTDIMDTDIKEISEVKMKALKGALSQFSAFELTPQQPKVGPKHLLFVYNTQVILDADMYKAEIGKVESVASSNTGFNIAEDALRFPNFGSKYSAGGNCAGIAYYTAKLYNTGSWNTNGAYVSGRYDGTTESLSWDITADSQNTTLLDKGLGDFKSASFVKDHKDENGLLTGLTAGEDEFVKMIGANWAQTNDTMAPEDKLYLINDTTGVYDWNMIKAMEQKLDNKQILILGMANSDGNGHAVNIVDYRTADNGDTVYFTLYDNMFPLNQRKGQPVNNVLMVKRTSYADGITDSFMYEYKPYSDCKYIYSSEICAKGYKAFIVMDSEYNIIK